MKYFTLNLLMLIMLFSFSKAYANVPLKMNDQQMKGTHNSYRKRGLLSFFIKPWRYHHPSLVNQLNAGVRQFELDLHYSIFRNFKVRHINIFDRRSHCHKFKKCLETLNEWSLENPNHGPLYVWLELKDRDLDRILPWWRRIKASTLLKLEQKILKVIPFEKIISPSIVQGSYKSLKEAVVNNNWPSLIDSKGKFVFIILNKDVPQKIDYYNNPNYLKLFFMRASSKKDKYAAFFKYDNPLHSKEKIKKLVKKNFIVSTNINDMTKSDAYNVAREKAGIESGAHFLSSDFIEPSSIRGRNYWFNDYFSPRRNILR